MVWACLVAVFVIAVGLLVWRDNRSRGPVCPWCGKPDTFGDDGTADVCANCGFDFRKDDY